MPAMTASQARVVNPVLSSVAQGYQNGAMVADKLFPIVTVDQRGGNVIQFSKEHFMLYGSQRAPGENTKRIQTGYSSTTYALKDYGLEGKVPWEVMQEAAAVPGIDEGRRAIYVVSEAMALGYEKTCADLALNASNYAASNKLTTLAGATLWSDFASSTSQPVQNVETAKEAIRTQTGKRPNTMVMGAAVFAQLKQHPIVRDFIKYTQRSVATPELLAALFGIEQVYVGDAIYSNDAGTTMTDVWGKSVVLAYTAPASIREMGTPTYGYGYQLRGTPLVEEPYLDRSAKSWIYPVTRTELPQLVGASAGYLISPAVV